MKKKVPSNRRRENENENENENEERVQRTHASFRPLRPWGVSLHTRRTAAGGGGCVSGISPTTDVRRLHEAEDDDDDGDRAVLVQVAPVPVSCTTRASIWPASVSSSIVSLSRVSSTV